MEVKAAFATGIVESNLRNLSHGDADSQGWRQERRSLYPDPTNLSASVGRFFDETRALRGKYGNAGELAAAVQRPAAQYRGRYAQVSGEADQLLQRYTGGGPEPGGSSDGSPLSGISQAPAQSGGSQLAALLVAQGVGAQQAPRPSMGLAAPAHAAGPVMPAGAQAVLSSGGPRESPGAALAQALGAVKGLAGPDAPAGAPEPQSAVEAGGQAAAAGGAEAAVQFARSRVGQYRETGGANRGPQLDQLQQRLGFKGAPWCAIFTSVAVTRGGAPKVARTASVAEVRRQAQEGGGGYQRGFRSTARPGDLILFGNRHIGMVESVNRDGSYTTIEGNTGAGTVARRRRARGSGDIVRPRYQ